MIATIILHWNLVLWPIVILSSAVVLSVITLFSNNINGGSVLVGIWSTVIAIFTAALFVAILA